MVVMSSETAQRTSFESSELSRSSAEVFAAAADHPVEVTRRDGEPFVLMSKRDSVLQESLLDLAAQIIGASVRAEGSFADRMSDQFPWMLALSPEDRVECADQLVAAARASFSTKQPHLAIAEIMSWRETATALAAGFATSEVEWLDDDELAERP